MKTPIALIAAGIFVWQFEIDAMGKVLSAFDLDQKDSWLISPTKVVTALILAGGSSLIFRLFDTFGLRVPVERQEEIKEAQQYAGLKVRIARGSVPKNRGVLVSVDDVLVGQVRAGRRISHRGWLSSGFFVEPGLRKIKVTAFAKENVQKVDQNGNLMFDAVNGNPVYEKDDQNHVVTKDVPVSSEVSLALAPRASITVDLSFGK